MPTYEYVCSACEHRFEDFESMSARPQVKCPACGKRKLRRLFGTGAGIIFKGSGFYENDYKKKTGTKPEAKPEAKPETKPESKPDAKPAAKKDAKKKD